ncbi:hypothetical protein [Paucidesulfovibrio longus]|uniref:hypothetical protein n=1 Tax=Paucidesulfovibrio longus TaxID=889 RepID=UPI0003B5F81E|nr:hypothetical protein [Paucidesulfovibrio longus]
MKRMPGMLLAGLICAAVALAVGSGEALADDGNTIPGEFGGVRMGAFMSDLGGMTFVRTEHVQDEVSGDYDVMYYTSATAPSMFGKVPLERVEFGFCDDYVCVIRAQARGRDAYDELVREYARIYGTEDRRVYLYDSLWDRYCDEERTRDGVSTRWILCEHETDNCAVFSITYHRDADLAVLLLGDQYAEP